MADAMTEAKPGSQLYLVRGDDPSLISRAVRELVEQLVGDGDRSLVVDELTETSYRSDDGHYEISALVQAAQTPPFLTGHRVVVGRDLGRFSNKQDLKPLMAYFEDPLDTTRLVLVWEKGPELQRLNPLPKSLQAAVAASGKVVDVRVPRGKQAQGWLEDQVRASDISLEREAVQLLSAHLGENRGRAPALLDTLLSAFGPQVTLTAADVEPYLGQPGDVAPWDLTDAIAKGDVTAALANLARMHSSGGRHALQILASLHTHYGRLLRLEGAGLRDEKAAAAALGMKGSTFPASKALQQARKLGSARVARSIELLARADLDVRGATAVDDATTLEVLVARLAALHR